jgi:predicted extracellular nuclease
LFAIGLYTLLEQADPELVKNETSLNETLQKLSLALHLPAEKLQKDLELYRANLEKMTQARKTLEDIIAADRRRREQQSAPAQNESSSASEAAPGSTDESQNSSN